MYSRASVAARSRADFAALFASARISRASSSACRWISAALFSAASMIARTCSLAPLASDSLRLRADRLSSSTSSEIARQVRIDGGGLVAAAPDWEVLLLDALPIKRHSSYLRSRLRRGG